MKHASLHPSFRLYIDESGDHANCLMDSLAHRYLALLGVWFERNEYLRFADSLGALKREFFGARPDSPVTLHRTEILNRKGPFYRLRDDSLRQKFDSRLLESIRSARFILICVVIDKKSQRSRYSALASPFGLHPYHFCLAAILFRYARWLRARGSVGDVMAESRGKEEDRQLKNAYRNLYESGTNALPAEGYQAALSSKDIKLKPKNPPIAGLELADILAHPIKMYCLRTKGLVQTPPGLFATRIEEVTKDKFLSGATGTENHGWICF